MAQYCNTTTDLYRVFPRLEQLKEARTLKTWTLHSGAVYKALFPGYGEQLFEDGAELAAAASLAAIAAGKFFYDGAADVLYLQPTTGTPTGKSYRWGSDWATLKSWAVDQGSAMLEGLLDPKFPVPLVEDPRGTATRKWDAPVVLAAAYFAASIIAGRTEPAAFAADGSAQNLAAQLQKRGEQIVDDYNSGKMKFGWEITEDEGQGANVTPGSSNTSVGTIQARGQYAGAEDAFLVLKVTTGGDVGTAKFALSTDNGTTYGSADAFTSSYTWQMLTSSVYVRFFGRGGAATAFVANDTWQLEVVRIGATIARSRIGSGRLIA